MLDKLRKQSKKLRYLDEDKYDTISNILSYDKCFLEMDMNTALNILNDLKVNQKDAENIYLELISKEKYEE